jgi:hypothetical protein
LELTTSLSVEAFFMAFRRFAARRGLPSTITSDNAKIFKSASKEIQRFTRSSVLRDYMTNHRISWQFIAPKAPWWGGYWERKGGEDGEISTQENIRQINTQLRRNEYCIS